MDLGLTNRACIVTGASRGIGAATAKLLAAEGAAVLLVGRNADPLAAVAAECGDKAQTLVLDITSPTAGEEARDACVDAFGAVDVVVNNAGTSRNRRFDELTDEDWDEQWRLNVLGPMRLMRAIAPGMAERRWGRIVNVSSSAGKRPSGTNIAYSTTKAAELSLSRAFAEEYAAQGVRVNAVAPGPVDSEMWMDAGGLADQAAEAKGIAREEAIAKAAAALPRGEFATPEEIARVVVVLCSEVAANVVGSAWSVDGGTVRVLI